MVVLNILYFHPDFVGKMIQFDVFVVGVETTNYWYVSMEINNYS